MSEKKMDAKIDFFFQLMPVSSKKKKKKRSETPSESYKQIKQMFMVRKL